MKRTLALALFLTVLCIGLSVIGFATGCAHAIHLVNPHYSVHNIRPRFDLSLPLKASTIDFDFDLGVDNPNSIGLRLERVDFDVFVGDQQLLHTISREEATIPAHGYGEVHLTSRIRRQDMRAVFDQVLDIMRGNRAPYHVRGSAFYRTPFGVREYPVDVVTTR